MLSPHVARKAEHHVFYFIYSISFVNEYNNLRKLYCFIAAFFSIFRKINFNGTTHFGPQWERLPLHIHLLDNDPQCVGNSFCVWKRNFSKSENESQFLITIVYLLHVRNSPKQNLSPKIRMLINSSKLKTHLLLRKTFNF